MTTQTAPETSTFHFQHHDTYATIAEMDADADAAGYSKVPDKASSIGFHYERPPGPCPAHDGNNVWWTQKKYVSRVGMWETKYQIYTGQ
tara:strand:+ start:630 stop:896 length:267 start_codon:yes stop_codon:yes gene_type:complete